MLEDLNRFTLSVVDGAGLVRVDDGTTARLTDAFVQTALRESLAPIAGQGRAVFVAAREDGDLELWASDGTAGGTRAVLPLGRDVSDTRLVTIEAFGDGALSVLQSGDVTEIWYTDGTAAGSRLLSSVDGARFLDDLVVTGGRAFVSWNGSKDFLTVTDGTVEGTRNLVAPRATDAERFGDGIVFTADDPQTGVELWFSDGTQEGTGLVADILPGGTTLVRGSDPSSFGALGDQVIFEATWNGPEGAARRELWLSDGTEAGTRPLSVAVPGSPAFNPGNLFELSDALLAEGPSGLWRVDTEQGATFLTGTEGLSWGLEAPVPIADGAVIPLKVQGQQFRQWVAWDDAAGAVTDLGLLDRGDQIASGGGALFAGAETRTAPSALYFSNGTPEGTRAVEAASFDAPLTRPGELVEVGSRIFFAAETPQTGRELWVSDAGSDTARLVADIAAGATGSDPKDIIRLSQDRAIFTTHEAGADPELWITDGTPAGTRLLFAGADEATGVTGYTVLAFGGGKAIIQRTFEADFSFPDFRRAELFLLEDPDGDPQFIADAGITTLGAGRGFEIEYAGGLVFSAGTPQEGRELWFSDGTVSGTRLLADLVDNSADSVFSRGSSPGDYHLFGDSLVFEGRRLHDDGFLVGDVFVLNGLDGVPTPLGLEGIQVTEFAEIGPHLLMSALYEGRDQLIATDGTPEGTVSLVDGFDRAAGITRLGDQAVIRVTTPDTGQEPWITDGTPEGTRLLSDIFPNLFFPFDGNPVDITPTQGFVYFSASPGFGDLWLSDGTAEGTRQILPDRSISRLDAAGDFVVTRGFADGALTAFRGETATELGVQSLLNGAQTAVLGGKLVFEGSRLSGEDAGLWITDGTLEGTVRISGVTGVFPFEIAKGADGRLWFVAFDQGGRGDLWRTDGTADGTVRIAELPDGVIPRVDIVPVIVGDRFIFAATNGTSGIQLWQTDGTGEGIRLVRDIDTDPLPAQVTALLAVEDLAPDRPFTQGDDRISGTREDDVLRGGDGDDLLKGRAGDDRLLGDGGDDKIRAGNGDDHASGSSGQDRIFGQNGDDTLLGGDGDDDLRGQAGGDMLDGGHGDDRARGGPGNDLLHGGTGEDSLQGGSGDDALHGGFGNDDLRGGQGDDTLSGEDGDDRLRGGSGEDTLLGGDGDDTLDGQAGDDLIDGGAGDDVLRGGRSDRNVFVSGEGHDVILDFDIDTSGRERSFDTLRFDFSGRDWSLSTAQDFADFITLIEKDGDGDTDAVMQGNSLILDFGEDSVELRHVIDDIEERHLDPSPSLHGFFLWSDVIDIA